MVEKRRLSLRDFGWIVLYNIILLQFALQGTLPWFSYLDEMIAIILIVDYLFLRKHGVKSGASHSEFGMALLLVALLAIGFLGNAFNQITGNIGTIITDAFTCVKFGIVFLLLMRLTNRKRNILYYVEIEIKLLCIPMLVLMVMNWFVNIGMGSDIRFGLRSFVFIYRAPTVLVGIVCDFIAVLTLRRRKNALYIFLLIIVLASTFRSKAFGLIGLYIGLGWMLKRGKRIGAKEFTALSVAGVIIGWDQIVYYFSNSSFARAALHAAAYQIANDYFPLGTGFATFASHMANINYSSLYYKYGLSSIHGLQASKANFASDTFWPIILGQFGWFGVVIFLLIIYALFKVIKRYSLYKDQYLAALTIFVYLVISSTSESSYFHPTATTHFFTLAIILNDPSANLLRNRPTELASVRRKN